MVPFRFRLQPALERAYERERTARVAVVRAQLAFNAVDADVNDLRLRMEALHARDQGSTFVASACAEREACIDALGTRRRRRAAQGQLRKADVERARVGYAEASRRRSALERLRERGEAEHRTLLALADAAEEDEANSLRTSKFAARSNRM